jgi:hypothetical protein
MRVKVEMGVSCQYCCNFLKKYFIHRFLTLCEELICNDLIDQNSEVDANMVIGLCPQKCSREMASSPKKDDLHDFDRSWSQ